MNKNFLIKVLGLVVLAVAMYFIFHKDDATPVVVEKPIEKPEDSLAGRNCYLYDQLATIEAPYEVHEKIDISVDGKKVSGIKSGTQAGPDMTNGYEGTLIGTLDDNMLTAIFSYTVEGSAQKEKEVYAVMSNSLVKHRYVLAEEQGVLVPDMSGDFREIVYNKIGCNAFRN